WAFSGDREERVALVGTVEQGARLQPWLERKNLFGLRTIGLISPEPSRDEASMFPVLGTVDKMGEILRAQSLTPVIVMHLTVGKEWLRQTTQMCEDAAVRLLALNKFDDFFSHTTTTFEDDGVHFISLREEPLESPLNRCLKRALDLAVAGPVVIFILPLVTMGVWLLQRW